MPFKVIEVRITCDFLFYKNQLLNVKTCITFYPPQAHFIFSLLDINFQCSHLHQLTCINTDVIIQFV